MYGFFVLICENLSSNDMICYNFHELCVNISAMIIRNVSFSDTATSDNEAV